ncbi:acyl-CoA desaturase [bacterium]|nr:MAG: acyl-CoA desaturase [bacterium]
MTVVADRKPVWQTAITLAIMIVPCLLVVFAAVKLSMSPERGNWTYVLTVLAFLVVGIKARMYGISLGFHRGLTHKSYETHPWLRGFFLALGCASIQGEPVRWATEHVEHHRHADKDGDPHSPEHGFWHAHWGWLVDLRFNREINPVFKRDKLAMWISKTTWIWAFLGFAIPAAVGHLVGIGWWDGLLWGGGVAVFFANQGTYWVNSGAHTFGRRDFETDDRSTNFWLKGPIGYPISLFLAWVTCGETNHNNHHAIGHAANHGMFKGQFDPSARLLRVLEKLKLVWNVRWINPEEAERRQRELRLTPEERKAEALRAHQEKRAAATVQ